MLGGGSDGTYLIVKDNGCGIPPKASRGNGMGIRIMENRALHVGAILSVVASKSGGTSVVCQLPRTDPIR